MADPNKDLSAVSNHISIACSAADCTTLNYGGSCSGLGPKENISYAFNSYYQMQMQNSRSCDFDGYGIVTFLDPSVGDCRFLVGVTDTSLANVGAYSSKVTISLFISWWFLFTRV